MEDSDAEVNFVEIDGDFVKVWRPEEHHRYLGRQPSLSPGTRLEAEFNYRKDRAGVSFHKHKKMRLNQNVSLRNRTRFFDICVSPAMTFSLAVFPMTKTKYQEMDRVQNKCSEELSDGDAWMMSLGKI